MEAPRSWQQVLVASLLVVLAVGWATLLDARSSSESLAAASALLLTYLYASGRWRAFFAALAASPLLLVAWHLLSSIDIDLNTYHAIFETDSREALDFLAAQSRGWLFGDGQAARLLKGYLLLLACALAAAAALRRRFVGKDPSPSAAAAAACVVGLYSFGLTSIELRWYAHRFHKAASAFSAELELFRLSDPLAALGDGDRGSARDVDIILYVGESTTRWNWSLYGYPRSTNAPLSPHARTPNLILLKDAISPHSHTGPSMKEVLSVLDYAPGAPDPERPVSIVDLLNHAGFETLWLSNQNRYGTWDNTVSRHAERARKAVFSSKTLGTAFEARKKDDELLRRFFEEQRGERTAPRLTVLHSYAGHGNYCENLVEVVAFRDVLSSLGPAAIFGDAGGDRGVLECYDAAMHEVSRNLAAVFERTRTSPRPTVLLYAPDHGEDPWRNTWHDSSRHSARHVEVPALVFFNDAALARYPDFARNAARNARLPFKTSWLFDSVAHLAGVAETRFRMSRSLFSERYSPRPRYCLPGDGSHVAYDHDPSRPSGGAVRDVSDHLSLARKALAATPPGLRERLCAHRADSLFNYLEAKQLFDCVEVDVVLGQGPGASVYHPPKADHGLGLAELLDFAGLPRKTLWVDVKDLDEGNYRRLLDLLARVVPRRRNRDVIIETSLTGPGAERVVSAFRKQGFPVSYYLPTRRGIDCSNKPSSVCDEFAGSLSELLGRAGFSHLSFDADAWPFVRDHRSRLPASVRLLTWDLLAGLPSPAPRLQKEADVIIVPFRSPFSY